MGVIDRILEDDKGVAKKQRHTAMRIHDRLRSEYGFPGDYTIVKDYVRERRRRLREMYVPLNHPPGHAQCDFGQAKAVIGGVERKIHYFVLDLPHSDGCFVKAYPGGDHGGLLRRPRLRLHVSGRSTQEHPVRQHPPGGGEDPGRRPAEAYSGVQRTGIPLPVRRPVWSSRQGKLQR